MGSHSVSDRVDSNGNEVLLSRKFLSQYARYFAHISSDGRASRLSDSGGTSRDPYDCLRHLQRVRALRERSRTRKGRISEFGEVPVQGTGLECSWQYQRLHNKTKQDS